jgi:cold shock CspA family protein
VRVSKEIRRRLQKWTFPSARGARHALVVVGQIRFYDESTAWGVILGADGALYAVRGAQLSGAPVHVGERVVFEPEPAPGGPRAAAVRRFRGTAAPG